VKGKLIWSVFWALVGIFVVIVSVFFITAFIPAFRGSIFLWFITVSGAIFFLLGVALIFLTVKEKVGGMLKKFLLLTGASAAGFIISVFLHNAFYGLGVMTGHMPVLSRSMEVFHVAFFIMAIFVCPIGFLVGAVGSIVLAIKKLRMAK
jgi:hypothetical protein